MSLNDYLNCIYEEEWIEDMFDDKPKNNQEFLAQDGSIVYYDKLNGWYRFKDDNPTIPKFKAGDMMPYEWGIM